MGDFELEKRCLMHIAHRLGNIQLAQKPLAHQVDLPFGKTDEQTPEKRHLTKTDIRCQATALKIIYEQFPNDAVEAEEDTPELFGLFAKNNPNIRRWTFDPLDGSHNFSNGFDSFGFAGGFSMYNEYVAAVIYTPMNKTMYVAVKGKGVRKYVGSLRKSVPVRVAEPDSAQPKQGDTIHINGPDQDLIGILEHESGLRFQPKGLASIDRAIQVVDGRANAYIKHEGKIYSVGPASFVVREAGGTFIDLNGNAPRVTEEVDRKNPSSPRIVRELESFAIMGPKKYSEALVKTLRPIVDFYNLW